MKNAESAVIVLETLASGEPWRDVFDVAVAAVATEAAAADAVVFPREERPVTADTLNQYVVHTGRWPATGYDGHAIDLHGRCVRSHPELAACLRSVACLEDIAAAAARQAAPADHLETFAAAGHRAAAVAVKRYKLSVARQLAAVDGHEFQAAAKELLACDDLAARLEAARQCHEAHAQLELDRVADEVLAASRAVAAEQERIVTVATERARDAAAEAARTATDLRIVKADALAARCRARLEAAARTNDPARRLELQHLRSERELHSAAGVAAEARSYSIETITRLTAILNASER